MLGFVWYSPRPMMTGVRLRVLGSGSSGNASLVTAGGTTVLVEAGLAGSTIEARIRAAGSDPTEVRAVFVSHEHGDHCRGALPFARRHGTPVVATAGTWRRMGGDDCAWTRIVPTEPLRIGALTAVCFPTPHDAEEPVGFRFEHRGERAVLVTDIGHVNRETAAAIEDASLLLIESNYDEQELHESPYPFSTRLRIASEYGHLSNGALAAYLRRSLPRSVHTVVLAHLSQNTNSPELALRTAQEALEAAGRFDVRLLVARRGEPTPEVATRFEAPRLAIA